MARCGQRAAASPPPRPTGVNAEQRLTGLEILERADDPGVRMVGCARGLGGRYFTADVASGDWKIRGYKVSSTAEALGGNHNWFTVEEFVAAIMRLDAQ